ncbi:MAG: hypothetical protein ABSE89_02360 [Sedimentisphaerales bacterium]
MKRKPVENIIYEVKEQVAKKVLAKISPIRKFPEDFLDEATKKDLGVRIKYPKTLKLGPKIIKRGLQTKKAEINLKEIRELSELVKDWEKESEFKYEEVILPEGEVTLNFGRKVEICLKGMAILKFNSYEQAKYVLYSRKKGQMLYKIPKDETAVKKAVKDYEKYLNEIREKLKKAYMKRKANREGAEYLAYDVMKENGLRIV